MAIMVTILYTVLLVKDLLKVLVVHRQQYFIMDRKFKTFPGFLSQVYQKPARTR